MNLVTSLCWTCKMMWLVSPACLHSSSAGVPHRSSLTSAYPSIMKLYLSRWHTVNNNQKILDLVVSPCEASQLEQGTTCVLGLGWTCQQVCFDQGMRACWSLSLKDW